MATNPDLTLEEKEHLINEIIHCGKQLDNVKKDIVIVMPIDEYITKLDIIKRLTNRNT